MHGTFIGCDMRLKSKKQMILHTHQFWAEKVVYLGFVNKTIWLKELMDETFSVHWLAQQRKEVNLSDQKNK